MPNDIVVTKNTTSGSERWDVTYTADQAATVEKTMLTAGDLLDRNIKISITTPSGSATTPATTITPNDITISVNSSTGLITASNTQKTQSVTPTVSAGYVSSGTAGTITVSAKSATSQLSTQAGATISPTESEQTAVAANKYTLGVVKVGAISSTYVGSGITQRDSTDLSVSGATVTAPAGYYSSSASASVASMTLPTSASSTSSGTSKATISRSTSDQYINIPTGYNGSAAYYKINATPNGSATTPATTIYAIPTITIDSTTGGITVVNNETQSVTPTVSAGYVSSGTAGTITVSGGASTTLSTVNGATITPTTSNQTAVAAGKYTLGAVTVAGDANLVPANIASGVTIFGVTGTHQGGGATISTTQDSHGGDILTITTTGNVSNLQYKTVTPSGTSQTIIPDSGYDGLSEVILNAIPSATGVDF